MTGTQWPFRPLAAVPGEHIALRLADRARKLAVDAQSRCDIDKLCAIGGFRYKTMALETKVGGHEALLVPRVDGTFEILVDARGDFADHRVRRRRLRFRVAHEIGHSFFYDRRYRPARRLLSGSEAEEAFCDAFASALLVPPAMTASLEPSPKAIIGLAKRFDVSIEAAARAFSKYNHGISVFGLQVLRRNARESLGILWSVGPSRLSIGTHLEDLWAKAAATTRDEEQELVLEAGGSILQINLARLSNYYFLCALRTAG